MYPILPAPPPGIAGLSLPVPEPYDTERRFLSASHLFTLRMTSEELKQDFESALIKHLHFKSRLRSFLYGNGLSEGPLRDPEQCGFGLWIASRLRGPYAHIPESQLLDQEHVRIHQEANRLMDLHQAGAEETAIAGFHAVQLIADDITQLLRTIEDKLRTEG